ncbi:MAG: RNA polymerase sigma factor SigZ [Chloroflexota bacterium]
MNTVQTEALWQNMHTDLKQFINKRVPDEHIAEDILQDVFIRVHMQMDTLKDTARLESWIYQIARNAIVDDYRRRKPELDIPETLLADDERDEDDLTSQLAPCLRDMIQALPNKYRDAILLTEYEGLTQSALAARLNISLSGAKSRVQRAKELLKAVLLQCCHFELDRLGKIIDYYPHYDGCSSSQGTAQTDCTSRETGRSLAN